MINRQAAIIACRRAISYFETRINLERESLIFDKMQEKRPKKWLVFPRPPLTREEAVAALAREDKLEPLLVGYWARQRNRAYTIHDLLYLPLVVNQTKVNMSPSNEEFLKPYMKDGDAD